MHVDVHRTWGYKDPRTGQFSGMSGQLQRKEADIGGKIAPNLKRIVLCSRHSIVFFLHHFQIRNQSFCNEWASPNYGISLNGSSHHHSIHSSTTPDFICVEHLLPPLYWSCLDLFDIISDFCNDRDRFNIEVSGKIWRRRPTYENIRFFVICYCGHMSDEFKRFDKRFFSKNFNSKYTNGLDIVQLPSQRYNI